MGGLSRCSLEPTSRFSKIKLMKRKRRILNLLLHSLAKESQERLAGLDQREFRTLYVNWGRAANRGSKAAYSANNSFKPRPLRGLARDSLAGCGPA